MICPPSKINQKWDLWSKGTCLRGANIYQRRIYKDLDGSRLGRGKFGPPYSQRDLNKLRATGANYVNISMHGLFSEGPPYTLDFAAQANLDQLLIKIKKADMFAVISFRSGPGRSEMTFLGNFGNQYKNENVWKKQSAQDAWVAMWDYTANRYKDHPIVVGYDLMVEPNANDVLLHEEHAETFYQRYAGTLYDWNPLAKRISRAIRATDSMTPILIGGMNWSDLWWLNWVVDTRDKKTIYTVHNYEPYVLTHQPNRVSKTYPGRFDGNYDGIIDDVDAPFMEFLLAPLPARQLTTGQPVAVNEFGIMRWIPGADLFLNDQMSLFEQWNMNYALWIWETSHQPYATEETEFNYRFGPDKNNKQDTENDLHNTIKSFFGLNSVFPSDVSDRWGSTKRAP